VTPRELVDAYAICADRRDADSFAALFASDATLTTYELDGTERHTFSGVGEIASIPERLRRYERTMHHVTSHLVVPAGPGRATGEAYCLAHHLGRRDDGLVIDHLLQIRYVDGYELDGERWRFTRREVRTAWVDDRLISSTG
jgi:hypothetical protein